MTTRRWVKVGAGVAAGIVTIIGFFGLLMTLYNFEITDLTGNFSCEGTYENPCISEFNVRNPNGYVVDVYSKNQVKLDFSPDIKDYALFVPDGRCSATGKCACDLKDGSRLGFEDWRCVDFTNKTKPRKDRVYNFRFGRYSTTKFRLAGIKNNPSDVIKWGFGVNDSYLDPVWYGQEIGYEFLDNNYVVHIWNTQDDYYFEKDAGIQLTNHYEDYWTKNVFCLGYYSGETWVKIKCADELDNFNRQIESDNLTYVNATLWKDINYFGYDIRLGINYLLEVNDTNLSITIYAKNIGIDIPFDLGFAWKIQEVYIPGLGEDYIDVNGSSYLLNQSNDFLFKNMNESYLKIHDLTKFLRLDWDASLNDAVKIESSNQDDFYVMVLINAGHFNPGQEKQTTFQWIDADTVVDSSVFTNYNQKVNPRSLVWTDNNVGYILFIDNAGNFHYRKTTDGGANWDTEVSIREGSIQKIAVWYDKWTSGDTGDVIHVAFIDADDDDITYNSFSISDDTLDGEITVFSGTSAASPVSDWSDAGISIVKSRGGNIYVGGWIDLDGENGFWRATDSPATSFSARVDTGFIEGNAVDRIMFLAGSEADSDDIWSIYQDVSADIITLKVYDNSGNSWSESSTIDSISENAVIFGFDSMDRHSDGHAILVLWNALQSNDGDLAVHDITDINTFSQKTNVVTNSNTFGFSGLLINQQNDDLYVAYTTGVTTAAITYQLSQDGGDNWDGQTAMSETSDDHRQITGGTSVGDDGGKWMPIWFNDDLDDILANLGNSITINESVPLDTCTYTSGDWAVDCSDNCSIDSDVNLGNNNLSFSGAGEFNVRAWINNTDRLVKNDFELCKIFIYSGGFT